MGGENVLLAPLPSYRLEAYNDLGQAAILVHSRQHLSQATSMDHLKKQKLISWIGFYVLLPLAIYPTVALGGAFRGAGFATSLCEALATGDLLFFVALLLST